MPAAEPYEPEALRAQRIFVRRVWNQEAPCPVCSTPHNPLACEDTDDPAEAVRVLSEALRVAKTDQMGTGRILYFPGIKYEPDVSEGEA